MPIDHSIYFQQRAPDILGNAERGLRLSDLMTQRREQNRLLAEQGAIRDAAKRNTSVGEDGTVTMNRGAYLSDLAKVDPMKAMDTQKSFQASDREEERARLEGHLKKAGAFGQILGGANSQATYNRARSNLINLGLIDEKDLPLQYDPDLVKSVQAQALGIKEQLDLKWRESEAQRDQKNKDRDFGQKEREINAKTATTLADSGKMTEAQSKSLGFGRRALISEQILQRIQTDPSFDATDYVTQARTALPKWLGGIKSPKEQAMATAKLGFVASVLRKESGAAVTPEEYSQYDKMYFPQPGDSAQTLADKATLRANFIDTEKLSAGRAWRDPMPLTNVANGGPPRTSIPGIDSANAGQQRSTPIYKTNEIDWAD